MALITIRRLIGSGVLTAIVDEDLRVHLARSKGMLRERLFCTGMKSDDEFGGSSSRKHHVKPDRHGLPPRASFHSRLKTLLKQKAAIQTKGSHSAPIADSSSINGQHFIRSNNETLSIAAMGVSNPDSSPLGDLGGSIPLTGSSLLDVERWALGVER